MTLPQARIFSSKSLDVSKDTKQADFSASEAKVKVEDIEMIRL